MQLPKAGALALLLMPLWAHAHSPMPGVMPFYGGILHPFVVPAHTMAMVTLALLIAQNTARDGVGRVMLTMLITLVAGAVLGGLLGDPDTDPPLLAATAVAALLVVWARPTRPAVVVGTAAVIGLLMGMGSGPEGIIGLRRWTPLAGTFIGVFVGTAWVLIIAEHAQRPWQKIAVRVVASWIAASAVIVLALASVGPRRVAVSPPVAPWAGQPHTQPGQEGAQPLRAPLGSSAATTPSSGK